MSKILKSNQLLFVITLSALAGCQSPTSQQLESSTAYTHENKAFTVQSLYEPSGNMLLEPLSAGACLYNDEKIKVSCYSNNTFNILNVHFKNRQDFSIDSPEHKLAYRTILNADTHQPFIEKLIAKNVIKNNSGQYFSFKSYDRECQVQPFTVWDKNYNSSIVSIIFVYTCSVDKSTLVRLFELKQKAALELYKDQVDPSTITVPLN